MPLIISKVDKQLVINPKMRGIFPNEKTLRINLPAGQEVEVPDYVLEYYTKHYPHIYRAAGEIEIDEDSKEEEYGVTEFDPVTFLQINYSRIEEALNGLERKELLSIGKVLKLNSLQRQGNDRIIERIVQDINVKQAQQKKLEKHEGIVNV